MGAEHQSYGCCNQGQPDDKISLVNGQQSSGLQKAHEFLNMNRKHFFLDQAAQRLGADTDRLFRDASEVPHKSSELNQFLEGTVELSNYQVDEYLNELQEESLSAAGIAFFVAAIVRSSYKYRVFDSFCTGRIIVDLGMMERVDQVPRTYWGASWSFLNPMELVDVLTWLNWLISENLAWTPKERPSYIEHLGPVISAISNLSAMIARDLQEPRKGLRGDLNEQLLG